MKKSTAAWIRKAENDFRAARVLLKRKAPLLDEVCFHCQQTIEKYFKGMLEECGLSIPRTHDLILLFDRLIVVDPTLRVLRRGTDVLTRYAAEYRYPGQDATARQAKTAFAKALRFREEIRKRLGLPTRRFK